MKKIFFGIVALVAMVATSCQQSLDELNVVGGGDATVTFNVGAGSRAYSDGKTATNLQWAVYAVTDNGTSQTLSHLSALNGSKTFELSTTVEFQLTTGNKYAVIFWADADNSPYTVTFGTYGATMTVDYNSAKSNDENRDAFYKYHEFTVSGSQTESVELKRPFAQLNIGTNDFEVSKNAGYTVSHVKVEVPAYKTLDLVSGEATGDVTTAVLFDYAAIPTTETFPVSEHQYMAMNYVLMNSAKETFDVTFTYATDENGANAKSRTVGSVPFQRNHRTNLYGQLLTSNVAVNVEIKPEYDDAFNNEGFFVTTNANGEITTVTALSAKGLATIADQIADGTISGDVDIVLNSNIDLAELATRAVTTNWAPIGTADAPFTGTLDGNGFTIKNLNIVQAEAKEDKAYIGFFGYAENTTIKNVTFENVNMNIPCLDIDHSQGHIGAVAGSLEGTSTIENVTVKGDIKVYATQDANGASRVAVVAGGNSYGNVTMKNVHVIANEGSYLIANNNTGALAGQLQGKSVFENCSSNINVTVNKFFAGGIIGLAAGDQLFENCHTTGDIKVVAGREGRAHDQYRVGGIAGGWSDGAKNVCTLVNCSYTGKVSGKNSDGSVAEPLDYLGYVGRGYTLNGCQGSKVVIDGIEFVQKYNTAAEAGVYTVTNAEGEEVVPVSSVPALKEALVNAGAAGAGNSTIYLAAGEYTMPSDWAPITVDGYHGADIVTIEGNGAVLKGLTTSLFNGGFAGGSGIVIKNLTIDGAAIVASNTQGYGAFVNCADSMAEITLINCHLLNSSIITPNDGANESRIGGLVGWTSGYSNQNDGPVKTYVTIQNCSVVGCTLKGFGSIGGICGHAGASDWTYTTIENCTVKDNTLVSTDDGSWRVGVAVGTANVGEVVVNNLTESGNTLTQGSLVAPTGVRSYAGRLALGTTGSFVVDGVAITE